MPLLVTFTAKDHDFQSSTKTGWFLLSPLLTIKIFRWLLKQFNTEIVYKQRNRRVNDYSTRKTNKQESVWCWLALIHLWFHGLALPMSPSAPSLNGALHDHLEHAVTLYNVSKPLQSVVSIWKAGVPGAHKIPDSLVLSWFRWFWDQDKRCGAHFSDIVVWMSGFVSVFVSNVRNARPHMEMPETSRACSWWWRLFSSFPFSSVRQSLQRLLQSGWKFLQRGCHILTASLQSCWTWTPLLKPYRSG